jgi:hypothetical protein
MSKQDGPGSDLPAHLLWAREDIERVVVEQLNKMVTFDIHEHEIKSLVDYATLAQDRLKWMEKAEQLQAACANYRRQIAALEDDCIGKQGIIDAQEERIENMAEAMTKALNIMDPYT